jgi:hypothetical protein
MQSNRRPLIFAAAAALLGLGVWTYLYFTPDPRMAQIDLIYKGALSEFAQSGAELPMTGSYDVGLGFFDVALMARPTGIEVAIKPSTHSLAYPGDLTFQDGKTRITVPIDGLRAELPVFDGTAKRLGTLSLMALFRPAT